MLTSQKTLTEIWKADMYHMQGQEQCASLFMTGFVSLNLELLLWICEKPYICDLAIRDLRSKSLKYNKPIKYMWVLSIIR